MPPTPHSHHTPVRCTYHRRPRQLFYVRTSARLPMSPLLSRSLAGPTPSHQHRHRPFLWPPCMHLPDATPRPHHISPFAVLPLHPFPPTITPAFTQLQHLRARASRRSRTGKQWCRQTHKAVERGPFAAEARSSTLFPPDRIRTAVWHKPRAGQPDPRSATG